MSCGRLKRFKWAMHYMSFDRAAFYLSYN